MQHGPLSQRRPRNNVPLASVVAIPQRADILWMQGRLSLTTIKISPRSPWAKLTSVKVPD
jgi:hypothetical protein